MFENFHGNQAAAATLLQMIEGQRIPQTILLHGPEGVGKATLARRFAARLLGHASLIEQDDLSLESNASLIAEREKLPPEKRANDPLIFSSHPDFVTICPEGPLRQISIQQMRLLRDRAQFNPLQGQRRVFLVDQMDRANEQAANSLLKTLEEPPECLVLILTAENPYDLLPTIRSRAVSIPMTPLNNVEMKAFIAARGLPQAERRCALAAGCPGKAVLLDLAEFDRRREVMFCFLESAAGLEGFAHWARYSEKLAAARSEKLEPYLRILYLLLEDILFLQQGLETPRNIDVESRLRRLAESVDFAWVRTAVRRTDEVIRLLRRNIQKNIALDALILELRPR